MNWIRKSLANTISSLIAIILLLVFLFIGIISVNFITQKVEADLLKQTYLQSESISKDVENIFDGAETYTRQLSKNRDIIEYLKEVKTREDIKNHPNFDYVYNYLIGVEESEKNHFISWVASEQANFYLDSRGIISDSTYDVAKRPWYKIAMNSEVVAFTPPYEEWSSYNIVISSILALRDGDQVFGFVVVDTELSTIPTIIEAMEISPEDKTFIITENGNYVYHENKEITIGESIYDSDDPLSIYKNQIRHSERLLHHVTYQGNSYYLMSYEINRNGWRIVSLIDQTSVKKEIASIFKTIFTVMFALFFAVVLAIHLIVSERTAPYQLLVSYANDIAEGDFSKNIPVKDMERPDEMGEISQSFQRIISTFRDENILLEEKVEKINQVLEKQYSYILETEKAASLGNLVAGVSHEINTPLGVGISTGSHIEAITSASIDKMSSGEMSKEDLIKFFETLTEATAILNNNLNRAAKLVKSFKNIAVDQGSEIKEAFKLEQVIGDVITSLRNEYKRQKHEIQYHCSPEIIINSYPGLFAQLFTNLLMNAIQHGFRDKVEGIIKIDCWLDGSLLFIIFEDNGCGISEENQKKIFDPFYTTYRENGNSGLGMSIINNIVTQNLKGKIQVESEVSVFTRFSIVLPIEDLNE